MLRAIRRRLRTIAYYSARQERTVWTRTTDVLLMLSPLLALGLAAILSLTVERAPRSETFVGYIRPGPQGTWSAQVDGRKGTSKSSGDVVGDFEVVSTTAVRGWPFVVSLAAEPPKVTSRTLQAADAEEVRAAIERALREVDQTAVADALAAEAGSGGRASTIRRPGGMLGNVVVSWAALFFLLPLVVQGMRLVAWMVAEVGRVRRRRRINQGRCPNCGFDVRGSVWSANCPECGGMLG